MRNRRPLFAGNWKMHKTPEQTRAYVGDFVGPAAELIAQADIALLAPFVDLEALRAALGTSSIGFGAQDCFWEPEGAYTGAVSAAMLKALGCQYCIVGHSERRQYFAETDETVALKVSALLERDITPIVCVGESFEEHQTGQTHERVSAQVNAALGHLSDAERSMLVLAYEPIWAIGTGLCDDPQSANATIEHIRHTAGGLSEARVLYGGSMKSLNAASLCAQPHIDGGLVGSASLQPAEFLQLIGNALQVFDAR
jgi:triosephosphate isomerase